nr:GNAT family N-acetyltransferase [Tenggerimyces flavus]
MAARPARGAGRVRGDRRADRRRVPARRAPATRQPVPRPAPRHQEPCARGPAARRRRPYVRRDPRHRHVLPDRVAVVRDLPAGRGRVPHARRFPCRRGKGVGEALVRACLKEAVAEGKHGVVLSSSTAMAPAHRLYERLGFRRAADRDWEPVPGFTLLAFRREV